jgi:hypothetical protein
MPKEFLFADRECEAGGEVRDSLKLENRERLELRLIDDDDDDRL